MINADPQELAKFGELAHRWWDPDGEFRPLHQINPLRLDWIDALSPLSGREVVDVGCGGGILAESMARRGARVLGIDLSTKPLKVAQLHALESGLDDLEYRECAVEALASERPGAFDTVTCMELLEHVPRPESVVAACGALVRPGGWVFFSTLNRNLRAYVMAIVGAEQVLKLLPAGTHDYARFIRPSELATWARAAGLTVETMAGLGYNPLTQSYHLNRDTGVNYLVACRRVA
jgi:2-polyprenyl-6-hydroxyphenyl methylase/3-demethylubiquinone-9 3-methyltransferase